MRLNELEPLEFGREPGGDAGVGFGGLPFRSACCVFTVGTKTFAVGLNFLFTGLEPLELEREPWDDSGVLSDSL